MPALEAPPAPVATPAPAAPKAAPAPTPAPAPRSPSGAPNARARFSEGLRAAAAKGPNLANVDPAVIKEAGLDKPQPAAAPKAAVASPTATPKPSDAAPKPGAEPNETLKPGDTPAPADATPKPGEEGTPPKGDKGKPGSAWKLVGALEKRTKELERQLAETLEKVTDPERAAATAKRLEAAEARAKELEEHIRFVDYSKSEEFATKYRQPYEEAWAKAGRDLSELKVVVDATGATRPATLDDLHALATMPLGEARARANEMFGDAADDVMAHRRAIRELADAQNKALDDAKKTGAERTKSQTEAAQRAAQEAVELFRRAIDEDTAKYDFLRAKDGDDEWNTSLDKATKFVEGAWGTSASDPKLTPEQRAEIVRRHVAIRNRAIAFTPLKLEIKRLKAEVATLQKTVADYKGAEPGAGNGTHGGAAGASTPLNPMDVVKARIRALGRDVNTPVA